MMLPVEWLIGWSEIRFEFISRLGTTGGSGPLFCNLLRRLQPTGSPTSGAFMSIAGHRKQEPEFTTCQSCITGWWFWSFLSFFHKNWVSSHPNWPSHIFFRGPTTNQIMSASSDIRAFRAAKQCAPGRNMMVEVHQGAAGDGELNHKLRIPHYFAAMKAHRIQCIRRFLAMWRLARGQVNRNEPYSNITGGECRTTSAVADVWLVAAKKCFMCCMNSIHVTFATGIF